MQPTIRAYRPSDLDAVYDICVRTADAGGDARGRNSSDRLVGDVFAAPYVVLEPSTARILDDGQGNVAAMTLIWGRPLVSGGAVVTAELARLTVDQCALDDGRFTLLAPDDYRGDFLEVALYDARGSQLARESLYEDDGEDD